jgi:N-acetylglucosaminyldiphosphoundecaprenol N-acetyl-beta-D-mannosaminyltransferase
MPATPRAIRILGVRIDDVTLDEAVEIAAARIAAGGVSQFATVNPEFVMTAQRDAGFRETLVHSTLNVPDGVGILYAARRYGAPLRERVTGVALSQALCRHAAQLGWRVFLLGAQPGVAERAAQVLQNQSPGLHIAACFAGSPADAQVPEIVARVRATRPNLLLVAYGAPAQDLWLARHLPALAPEPGATGLLGMGVGGTFDYLAGVRRLAPEWIRKWGFEWLYRLLQEPRRWRRQLSLIRFMVAVLSRSKAG